MNELQALLLDLQSPSVWMELGGLALCLGLAWVLGWAIGRGAARDSIWFGRRVLDGLLFPVLSLAFTYALKTVLMKMQHVPVLKMAVPILLSLVAIRLIARVMTVVFPSSHGARALARTVSWVAWGMAVLWITGLLVPVVDELESIRFSLGKSSVSLLHVFEVGMTSVLVLVLSLWLSATIERRVLNQALSDLSMRKVASNTLRALLLMLGALFALSAVGVDLTALSVIGGALGVGIGFGLQKLAANYISGFVILLERSLRIGDYVRVDGFEGSVTDIKTRYTLIRATNGIESVVPNESLLTQRVENLSLQSNRMLLSNQYWIDLKSDPQEVARLLVAAALQVDRVLPDPEPSALLADVSQQGLRWTLSFWIDAPQTGQGLVRSEVNLAVLQGLRQAGVGLVFVPHEVVFPQ